MKIKFILLALLVYGSFASAALQYLTRHVVPETPFVNATAGNGPTGDDTTSQVSIGFNFPFNNNTYNQVWINSNGMLSFSTRNKVYQNAVLPYDDEPQSIYPYWDDLSPNNGGTIKYETFGSSPNMYFVISWDSVPHYSTYGQYTFQVVLYEDGAIRFRYENGSSADGTNCSGNAGCSEVGGVNNGATIGVQEDTSHYDQYSYDAAIDQTKDVLYVPNNNTLIDVDPTINLCTKIPQIKLTTYDTNGYADSYPDDAAEFQTWISENAIPSKEFGSGYVDNIYTASTSNNNPYHLGTDDYYMVIHKGFVNFPTTNIYRIGVDGDDAVEVYIDGKLITGMWGGHSYNGYATNIKYVNIDAGYHDIEFHMQDRTGGDSYYLYWDKGEGGDFEIIPPSSFFHCGSDPEIHISKTSIVISDPVNNTTNPKRIPAAIIRYCFTVDNNGTGMAGNIEIHDTLGSTGNRDKLSFKQAGKGSVVANNNACTESDCRELTDTSVWSYNSGTKEVTISLDDIPANSHECAYMDVEVQ